MGPAARPLLDHDVAGFDVAVDHQILVGEMHGGAKLAKELQAFAQIEFHLVAIAVDAQALDVLHDEVRPAHLRGVIGVSGSGVEQTGDVGVVDAGQERALDPEASHHFGLEHLSAQHLHGNRRRVAIAPRQIDLAHAA